MFDYLVYDVFTDVAFGGNQLAVFPNARDIPEELLQRIAAEFNFSEVSFVYPPTNPDHTARVRIFTPSSEIDFAGHPTIGTIIALSDQGYVTPMVLELGIGPLPCVIKDGRASFTASQALQKLSKPDPKRVAGALGLKDEHIRISTHLPLLASLGFPFVLVEVESIEVLSACRPNLGVIRQGAALYPASMGFAIFAYVRNGSEVSSRMFAPLHNISEDPATGSASATLAAVLTEVLDAPQTLVFTQGVDMGRPSTIYAKTTLAPISITISGQAVKTMTGTFIV